LRSFLHCSLSPSFYEYYVRQSQNVTYTPHKERVMQPSTH
jgi:hypothetical protein